MMRTVDSVDELKRIAVRVRVEIIKMIGAAGSGHPGGSLSAVELLVALYFRVLRHDPQNPSWPDRDPAAPKRQFSTNRMTTSA